MQGAAGAAPALYVDWNSVSHRFTQTRVLGKDTEMHQHLEVGYPVSTVKSYVGSFEV